jgi:CheY-like chemotaxis protein
MASAEQRSLRPFVRRLRGMKQELRVLLVEDTPADVELIKRELSKTGMEVSCQLVETEEEFLEQLATETPDLILSDHGVPGFGAPAALKLARQRVPEVPFLLVTGASLLDRSLEASAKADGHVSKNALEGLVPAVEQALRRGGLKKQAQQVEAGLRESRTRLACLVAHPYLSLDAREDIQEAERDFQEFLAVTVEQVHRLLTEVEKVLQEAFDRPEKLTAEAFADIAGSGKAVERMVDELAAYDRASRIPLVPMRLSVAELVRQLMRDCTEENPNRRIEWVIRPLPEVTADPSLLDAALRGMAGYVLAATRNEDPGRIEIQSEEDNSEVRIVFFHNGLWPAVVTRSEPLQAYLSASGEAANAAAAAGLARAGAAVKRHGGRIWMDASTGRSALWLTLPKAKPTKAS